MPDPPVIPNPTAKEIKIPHFMPFFWIACAFASGLLLADLLKAPVLVWIILSALTLLLWLLPRILSKFWAPARLLLPNSAHPRRLPLIALAAFCFLGALRYQTAQPQITPTHAAYYNYKGLVQLTGIVSAPPDQRDTYTALEVELESLEPLEAGSPLVPPETVHGRILLQVLSGTSHHYGDHISIRGNLQTPPDYGDFSYQDYLARQGIYSLMSYAYVELYEENAGNPILSAIYRLKDHSREVLQQNFPSPESDLLSGILLGDESGLSPQLKSAYQLTGTTHIIAISGFNIAILAGLITSLLNRALGTKWGTLAAILTIGVYTILVGADAAVVRAAIMGIAGAMGTLIGRRQNGLNTLGLAAFVMCIFNPNMPWDISFQLSFFATLGLVTYAPPLQARFLDFLSRYVPEDTAQRLAGPISEYFIFTLVAQALVLPLLAYHFGNFSPLFLLANPLILPPQPLVMILGGIALLGGLLNPALGKALAYLAWPFAAYTNRMVTWLATLPAGKLSISTFSFLWVVLYYLLFFTLTFAKDRKALFKQFLKPATLLLTLSCIVLIVWSLAFSTPDGRLTLTLLPETNSPVLLVETPQGRTILLNGGVRASALNQALGQSLPFGHRQIDVLVIPSCRRDDVIGLGGLPDRVEIKQALWICDPETIQTTRQLYLLLDENDAQQNMFEENAWLDLGNGAKLTMLAVDTNASYLTLEQENFRALLAFGKPETHPWETQTPLSLLVLPGNTKADNIHQADLNHLQVQLVFLPVDAQTLPLSGGLALAELFDDLPLYRTDLFGWLKLSTDGQQLWFNAQYSH